MKKIHFSVTSLLMICCIAWAFNVIAAKYDQNVYDVQQRLTELGYNPGPVDGKMGKKTNTAIKKYQQDKNLTVTGDLDEKTLQKLGLHVQTDQKQPTGVTALQYDGVYVSQKENNHYLRFYEDGIVIYVISSGAPNDVARWFHTDNEHVTKERYSIHGSRIKIFGKESEIQEKALIIGDSKYKFVPVRLKTSHPLTKNIYIMERILFDQYKRPLQVILKDIEGVDVAVRQFEFNKHNSQIIDRAKIQVENTDYTIEHDIRGNPTKFLCLDNEGHAIQRNGQPVFVEIFNAEQKRELENEYHKGYLIGAKTKIYPCKNCAEKTGFENCTYVW